MRAQIIERLRALLAEGERNKPALLAQVDALVAVLREARHDRRRVVDAGAALEIVARRRLYSVLGAPNMRAFLASHGISRTTAHRWRAIARAAEDDPSLADAGVCEAYESARATALPKGPAFEREHPTVVEKLQRAVSRSFLDDASTSLRTRRTRSDRRPPRDPDRSRRRRDRDHPSPRASEASLTDARCARCGRPRRDGSHDLSEPERRALRPSSCPKCSGGPDDAHPRCADATTLFYRCSCGVRWTEPR